MNPAPGVAAEPDCIKCKRRGSWRAWLPTRAGRRPPAALLLPALLVAAATLAPAAYLLLRQGFNFGLLQHELAAPSTLPLIWNTLWLMAGVCASVAVLGVGLAVLVARTSLPLARLWTVLFTLPLGVPTFVGSYAWVAFSYQYFPSSRAIFGLGGSILVISLTLFPYVFLPCLTALRRLDPAQEEVSRALGRSPIIAFLRLTLPQLRHAIATGLLICALHVLAEFGAVEMLSYQTLTTGIVQRVMVLGEPESARALAVVLALAAVAVLGLDRLLRGRAQPVRVGQGSPRPPLRWQLGRATPLWLLACLTVVLAALAVPLWVTLSGLLQATQAAVGPDWRMLFVATANTIQWGGWAALLATLVALPISFLVVRHPGRWSSLCERSVWVAHALPGVILALALVYISVQWFYPLYQTAALLVIAYVVMYLPLAVGTQQVGVAQASERLDEVSRALGKGPLATFGRITLPLSLPAIGAGALLVALDAGKELTTTLLLHPTGAHTLATRLWTTTEGEVLDFAAAAPYSLSLLIIGAIPALLLARATLRQ